MKLKSKKLIIIILCIIIGILIFCSFYFNYLNFRDQKINNDFEEIIPNTTNEENIEKKEDNINEKIYDTVKKLQVENSDVKGWIKINDSNINYPLLQGNDNDYYLNHNYQKEYSNYGSIFIDKDSNLDNVNSNVIIYGHSMKDKEMFQNLLNYANKEYYENHKIIEIYTNNETRKYEIVTVFKSRVFYQDEENVFRYYYCQDLSSEEKYNDYINNCKDLEIYSTGVEAHFGEQLITLITCEYSNDNGRMIVVAKKIS